MKTPGVINFTFSTILDVNSTYVGVAAKNEFVVAVSTIIVPATLSNFVIIPSESLFVPSFKAILRPVIALSVTVELTSITVALAETSAVITPAIVLGLAYTSIQSVRFSVKIVYSTEIILIGIGNDISWFDSPTGHTNLYPLLRKLPLVEIFSSFIWTDSYKIKSIS